MGILDNLENSDIFGDKDKELPFIWPKYGCTPIHYEHTPIVETDHMGREDYWKQPDLSL
jgi:hypothetical protein